MIGHFKWQLNIGRKYQRHTNDLLLLGEGGHDDEGGKRMNKRGPGVEKIPQKENGNMWDPNSKRGSN